MTRYSLYSVLFRPAIYKEMALWRSFTYFCVDFCTKKTEAKAVRFLTAGMQLNQQTPSRLNILSGISSFVYLLADSKRNNKPKPTRRRKWFARVGVFHMTNWALNDNFIAKYQSLLAIYVDSRRYAERSKV